MFQKEGVDQHDIVCQVFSIIKDLDFSHQFMFFIVVEIDVAVLFERITNLEKSIYDAVVEDHRSMCPMLSFYFIHSVVSNVEIVYHLEFIGIKKLNLPYPILAIVLFAMAVSVSLFPFEP